MHVKRTDPEHVGEEIHELIERLYPICRSITGNGVRETLSILQQYIALEVHEVPTGTEVFDWVVPKEWNIRDAYIKDGKGRRIVDFHNSNLHVVSYSVPVHERMGLSRLKAHLFSLPEHPDWIPYKTSYYDETWGFCLSHNQLLALEEGEYEVCIDSELSDGSLTYGEYFLPGKRTDEVLIYSHICHPSLCNDNLSGVVIATYLAAWLRDQPRRYSYRFVFAPGTIGSITWLCRNEERLEYIRHGLVLALLGDSGKFTYKQSRSGNEEIDRILAHTLRHSGCDYSVEAFSPYGYDERQFCSPGINLPVGRLTRTPQGRYPEYHTSGDNLDFVRVGSLAESFSVCRDAIMAIESNACYLSNNPKCEPHLGRRGLYRKRGGDSDFAGMEMALLWVLNLSDGNHSLLDIAERSGMPLWEIASAVDELLLVGLLRACEGA